MLEGYRRVDPAPSRKLAVPISVVHYIIRKAAHFNTPRQRAIANLCTIAFYYLLRAGEYSYTGKEAVRTIPFSLQDVTFSRGSYVIPITSTLKELYKADKATLRIQNQKNGEKDDPITQWANGKHDDPVKALARHTHMLWHATHDPTTTLSTFVDPKGQTKHIRSSAITAAVKEAARELNLAKQGIPPEQVSSHSLRAGGAMALYLNGADEVTIKKQGRWKSSAFLSYVHAQIAFLSKGLSTLMSTPIPFYNVIAAPKRP